MNEKEKSEISESAAMSRLISDLLQDKAKECKRLWIALLSFIGAFVVAVTVAVVGVVYTANHMQDAINEAVLEALNTFAEMEITEEITTSTTTTQEVDGDSAVINNVDGDQYNDQSKNIKGSDK